MTKIFVKLMTAYLAREEGMVTVEWVGITGVTLLAAILISQYILQGADAFAGAVVGNLNTAAEAINPSP